MGHMGHAAEGHGWVGRRLRVAGVDRVIAYHLAGGPAQSIKVELDAERPVPRNLVRKWGWRENLRRSSQGRAPLLLDEI